MHFSKLILTGLSSLSLLLVVGCGSSASEDSGTDEGAVEVADQPAATPVTLENFANHPRIVEIRKIVQAIDAKASSFTKKERRELCERIGDHERAIFSDGNVVRKLTASSGGDDAVWNETFYYENGVLRFAFRTIDSVHPVAREDRRYFDERGEEIIWVVREATGTEDKRPDIAASGTNRLGTANEYFDITPQHKKDPQKVFDAPPSCD